MAKKFFGIEINDHVLRVVTAETIKGVPVLTGASERLLEPQGNTALILAEMMGEVSFGDLVTASLPAVGCFYRLVELPFGEAKKIEAVLPLEMSSQVPASDELICDFLAARPREHGFLVPAAAVRRAGVVDVLELFRQAGRPLHLLDLNPFGFAAGLAGAMREGVLAVVLRHEIIVANVSGGRVGSFRNTPCRTQDQPARTAALIQRNYLALEQSALDPPPLFLIGEGASEDLRLALAEIGMVASYPVLELDGEPLAPALLPAAALALRGALPARQRQFNFLKGDLAPRSEWAGFRSRLITAAVLVGLTAILAVAGAYLNYSHKQTLAESLREETISVFRETFPQTRNIVNAPVQMRNNLAELQEKARLLGLGRDLSSLSILREVSARIPREITVDVRELIYNGDQLRLDGTTTTFEAINRLAQNLEDSSSFEQVQIADAKMSLDGSRVDFRLNLKLTEEDGTRQEAARRSR
jgi:general secretion pathway protein L